MENGIATTTHAGGIVARDARTENPAVVFLRRFPSPNTVRAYRGALSWLAARLLDDPNTDPLTFDWGQLRYAHTQALRADLARSSSPATANLRITALRGVLRECWRLSQIPADDYHRAVDLEPVRGSRLPRGRALTAGELRALFATCAGRGLLGARDAAILALGYVGGLRRAEIVGLDLSDFDAETGAVRVRMGKGNRERLVHLSNGALEALRSWTALRAVTDGPLLVAVAKGGRMGSARLSPAAILKALGALSALSGVAPFRPHDLRRSCASDLLDLGVDLKTVADVLGHAQMQTTSRYDRRPDERKRRAASQLHVPYVAPAV